MWTLTLLLLYIISVSNALMYYDLTVINVSPNTSGGIQNKLNENYDYKSSYFATENEEINQEIVLKKIGCTNNTHCHKIQLPWQSLAEESRLKRSAKIYPKTSVLLWKRRSSNNNNQLNVRRKSINKLRFELAHSPGIKPQVKNTDQLKALVKRSIKSLKDRRRMRNQNGKSRISVAKAHRRNKNRHRQTIKRRKQINKTKSINVRDPKNRFSKTTVSKRLMKRSAEESKYTTNDDQISMHADLNMSGTNERSIMRDISISQDEEQRTNKKIISQVSSAHAGFGVTPKQESADTSTEVITDQTELETSTSIQRETSSFQNHEDVKMSDMIIETRNNTPLTIKVPDETLSEAKIRNLTTINRNNTTPNRNTTELTYASINNEPKSTISQIVNSTKLAIVPMINRTLSLPTMLVNKTESNASTLTSVNNSTDVSLTNETTSSNSSSIDEIKSINTQFSNTLSMSPNKYSKVKQVTPNPKIYEWIKGNTHTLAVITVPLRKCPRGMRMRHGKCVNVY